jgi:hypothetical protein
MLDLSSIRESLTITKPTLAGPQASRMPAAARAPPQRQQRRKQGSAGQMSHARSQAIEVEEARGA